MKAHSIDIRHHVLMPIVILVSLAIWFLPAEMLPIDGMTVTQQRTVAIFVFAALMWMFEIIPNWCTSILIIVISLLTISDKCSRMAAFTGDQSAFVSSNEIMRSFADPIIMLFMGGFTLAIVASKYGLDVTIARATLRLFGSRPKFVVLGFICIIATFSMFMSDTATTAMFLTFLTPVLAAMSKDDPGRKALTLAIPFSAILGGIGTPIGTPPNATALGILGSNGIEVSFIDWAVRMVPFVVIMLLILWVVLTVAFPFKAQSIKVDIPAAPKARTWRYTVVVITYICTLLMWITEEFNHMSSSIIALVPLAVFSATGIFESEDIRKISWNVLWLVAGGFALGHDLSGTGLARLMVTSIDFGSMNVYLVFIISGLVCYGLSNFISNSATAALMIPILVAMSDGLMQSENAAAFSAIGGTAAIAVFIAICASLAMLFPVSTPSNALATSEGFVDTKDMTRIGAIIGVVGLVLGFFWITVLFPLG